MKSDFVHKTAESMAISYRSAGLRLGRAGLALSLITMLGACGDCVSVGVSGLLVTVVDKTTQGALTSPPSLLVTDGAWSQEFPRPFQETAPQFAAAPERPGVYRLLVRAEGYQDLVVDGVKVTMSDDECVHVRTVHVKMALSRTP